MFGVPAERPPAVSLACNRIVGGVRAVIVSSDDGTGIEAVPEFSLDTLAP
jgi:hypothetical protein